LLKSEYAPQELAMQSPLNYLSIEEYLTVEQYSEIRHEYIDGQVFAMTGGSKQHNQISLNLASLIKTHLRGTPCSVFIADMKVKISTTFSPSKNSFYYPDVVVTCEPKDSDRFFLNYPCLIIEVLSPSTEAIDKREKRLNYQTLDSLQEYILVSQEEINIEIYRKNKVGKWSVQTISKDEELSLESIDLILVTSDIYEEVFKP
jgi:Uma2 family endonuclease